jgi:hypothetical protein
MRIACSLSAARRVLLALAGFLLLAPAAEAAMVLAPRDTPMRFEANEAAQEILLHLERKGYVGANGGPLS